MIHRAHLHNCIKIATLSEDGDCQPIQLFLDCKMAELNKPASTLKLADGREFSGDLIIRADGAHVSDMAQY
jgi:2-polyprenyl-6-methoxyphenol hydroxylase-like FAD-dependent oxidoreductase